MTQNKKTWVNVARPEQTQDDAAAQDQQLAEAAEIRKECKQWLDTRDRTRITTWLNTLEPGYREKCRQQINLMMGARK